MGRMGRDTEQDRIGQADTSQKIACGKPESGKQEAPRPVSYTHLAADIFFGETMNLRARQQ